MFYAFNLNMANSRSTQFHLVLTRAEGKAGNFIEAESTNGKQEAESLGFSADLFNVLGSLDSVLVVAVEVV